MTMRELAKLANVSASTVSKAFNDAPDVSEGTKKHIFDIAKEQGCFHKFRKEKFSKFTIAIICPEVKSPYYAEYVERFRDIITENGGIALVSTDGFDEDRQAELIQYYAEYLKVDGIFVFHMNTALKKGHGNTPIVAIFSSRHIQVDSVRIDFEEPLKSAVGHLCSTGYKNIAFIGEKLTVYKAEKFKKIARTFPVNYITICSDHRFEKAGEDGIEKLLETSKPPMGIICAYDNIALGALGCLKQKVKCPGSK